MVVTKKALKQAYDLYWPTYGGRMEDYFALLYLTQEFGHPVETIAHQVAFSGNDYGIDAFHIDRERRNLYLFQFKWSEDHHLFRGSFRRLIAAGMERVFGNPLQDKTQNQLIIDLKSALYENQAVIDRVLIQFVFTGDPERAEESRVLDGLREELDSKVYLIHSYFNGRQVLMSFQYIRCPTTDSSLTKGGPIHTRSQHRYRIGFADRISTKTSSGETLHVGFVPLMDIYDMYKDMGLQFFERNIRAGLSPDKAPNRAIREALSKIAREQASAETFVFNHNGIAMAVQDLKFSAGDAIVIEPRLLNGAQTITSVHRLLVDNRTSKVLAAEAQALQSIRVLAKIINGGSEHFVTEVTIANNRQNPVEPWHLRASDEIQMAIEDIFRERLGIYYERLENAYESLTDADLDYMGLERQARPLEIKRLAQTFLAFQGELRKMSRLPYVFESTTVYQNTFKESQLRGDVRRLVLAYKMQLCMSRILRTVVAKYPQDADVLGHARNLLWALLIQGVMNRKDVPSICESYGKRLTLEADYSNLLRDLLSKQVRPIVLQYAKQYRFKEMVKKQKFDFLRENEAFQTCMQWGHAKYGWTKRSP